MKKTMIVLAFVLPAACTPVATPQPIAAQTCGATALSDLIGQPQSVLDGRSFDGPRRVIGSDQPMTMDYNPARLNFDTDDSGRIVRIWCG